MELIKRVKRNVYPRWTVLDVKIDRVSRRVLVKVEMKLSEDSKIKGIENMPSEWLHMKMPHYWQGKVRRTLRSKRNLKSLIGNRVRVPELEKRYKDQIKKKQLEVYSGIKRR